MKYLETIKWMALSSLLAFASSSCVDTHVVEPETLGESGAISSEVVINLTNPKGADTKAGGDYKLRYVARIFQGTTTAALNKAIATAEISTGDLSENNQENQIIFEVQPDSYYTILVFADYIPSETTANSSGHYKDCFYNTTEDEKTVLLIPSPGESSDIISTSFFNNDYHDCFYGMETFEKGKEEKVINLVLQRAVAKVIFREKSDNLGNVGITASQIGIHRQFYLPNGSPQALKTSNVTKTALDNVEEVTDNNKDIFYFYTFGGATSSEVSIDFNLTSTNLPEPQPFSVTGIPVKRNFKTIVSGEYIPAPEVPQPSIGDIILNLTTSADWAQEEIEK
ncbi:MAG: hypothetical protein J1F16_03850 [Muribaculaceae bacterium]|nr:hypothetical protein [Muribaculaceae bacterium]